MRVVYEWTQSEWDEAVRLAAAKTRRRGSISPITMGVVLVPLIGGAITGLINLRHSTTLGVAGTIVPVLLALVALCLVLWMVGMTWRMRLLRAAAEPMPTGACEAVLQEGVWRFCALTEHPSEDHVISETVATVEVSEGKAVVATAALTPWSNMIGTREGRRVVVFLHESGFAGLPMRYLSPDQVGHIQRMMARKLKPMPARR